LTHIDQRKLILTKNTSTKTNIEKYWQSTQKVSARDRN